MTSFHYVSVGGELSVRLETANTVENRPFIKDEQLGIVLGSYNPDTEFFDTSQNKVINKPVLDFSIDKQTALVNETVTLTTSDIGAALSIAGENYHIVKQIEDSPVLLTFDDAGIYKVSLSQYMSVTKTIEVTINAN